MKGIEVVVYEPALKKEETFYNSRVVNDFDEFKNLSDVIVANCMTDDLKDVEENV
ncbi:UDPglucose 6-dehydrogenase [Lentibacillus halodurans]|uniref:UDPglucose 6-dehydrogenase n=1 Tax=Lentibacillus halodurans TaxID=237679 RepID=A0A1I0XJC3_9BACI|nr:UDPglucose 6-dehydrogenase [Lentibacillus halodurans]